MEKKKKTCGKQRKALLQEQNKSNADQCPVVTF